MGIAALELRTAHAVQQEPTIAIPRLENGAYARTLIRLQVLTEELKQSDTIQEDDRKPNLWFTHDAFVTPHVEDSFTDVKTLLDNYGQTPPSMWHTFRSDKQTKAPFLDHIPAVPVTLPNGSQVFLSVLRNYQTNETSFMLDDERRRSHRIFLFTEDEKGTTLTNHRQERVNDTLEIDFLSDLSKLIHQESSRRTPLLRNN